ncbi:MULTISPECIES: sulfotransferase family 2 domain-containing protein [Halomonadaceae]
MGQLRQQLPWEVLDKQILFIHIPKAAGSSICDSLYGRQLGHVRCIDYQRINSGQFRSIRKFSVIRNPYERVYSAYCFLKDGGLPAFPADQRLSRIIQRYGGFESFVLNWLSCRNNRNSYIHFMPQSDFVTDRQGCLMVDRLGKLEELNDFIQTLEWEWGVQLELPHLNKSNRGGLDTGREWFSEPVREVIGELYSDDFRLGDYRR